MTRPGHRAGAGGLFHNPRGFDPLNSRAFKGLDVSEETILVSDSGKLKLTTQRVVLDDADHYAVIPIDMVASCDVRTTSWPWLLVLAFGMVLLAIFGPGGDNARYAAAFVGLVAFIGYFISRRGTIEVRSSGGGSIAVPTAGMSHDQAKRFADALSEQIERRC